MARGSYGADRATASMRIRENGRAGTLPTSPPPRRLARTRSRSSPAFRNPGSLGDWLAWLRSTGQYDPKQRKLDLFHMGPLDAFVHRDASSTMTITQLAFTEWRCLPDTLDPRGPKGK